MKYIDDQLIAELQKMIDSTSPKGEVLLDSRKTELIDSEWEEKDLDSSLDLNHAFNKIVQLASVRERCTFELNNRLHTLGYPDDVIDEALEKSVRVGIVDNHRFADIFIRSCISKNKGKRGIEAELKKRGIDCSEVEGWPDIYFSEDVDTSEYDRALTFIHRKPPTAKNKRDAAFRKLVNHGFDMGIARRAAQQYCEDIGWFPSR